MGTGGAPSGSSRRKKPSEERKRRRKSTAMAKSSKRHRQDSCSSSSRSDRSSPSTSSSDSEGSRSRKRKKENLVRRQQRQPSRDGGSLPRQNKNKNKNKNKKKRFQAEREPKRHDSRVKGNYQKKGRDRRRHHRSRSRSTSGSSPDTYSSRSCSTCRSGSSSPERTKSDRSLIPKGEHLKVGSSARGRSLRRDKDRSGGRASRGRRRSLSCSSCSRYSYDRRSKSRSHVRRSESERHSEEVMVAEKNRSRRLNEMEGRYCDGNDENRTDIIHDSDDLHSSQIDDRYDGGWGRDSVVTPLPPLQHASERKTYLNSAGGMRRHGHTGKEEAGSRGENSSAIVSGHVDGAQWRSRNDSPTPRARLKSQVSTCGDNSEVDELELLLRQKALENFKNFRDKLSTNANSAEVQKSIPFKSHEVATGNAEVAAVHESTSSASVPPKLKSYTYVGHRIPTGDGSHPLQFKSMSDANMPAKSMSDANMPAPACRVSGSTEKKKGNLMQKHPSASVNTESVPDSFISRSEPCPKEFEASPGKLQTVQESSGKTFSEEDLSANMLARKTSGKPGNTDTHKKETDKVNVSASTDSSCHKSASEFEQKTMSVMHGGEVVQVSYKVYIPKKTPALARRQLQR